MDQEDENVFSHSKYKLCFFSGNQEQVRRKIVLSKKNGQM